MMKKYAGLMLVGILCSVAARAEFEGFFQYYESVHRDQDAADFAKPSIPRHAQAIKRQAERTDYAENYRKQLVAQGDKLEARLNILGRRDIGLYNDRLRDEALRKRQNFLGYSDRAKKDFAIAQRMLSDARAVLEKAVKDSEFDVDDLMDILLRPPVLLLKPLARGHIPKFPDELIDVQEIVFGSQRAFERGAAELMEGERKLREAEALEAQLIESLGTKSSAVKELLDTPGVKKVLTGHRKLYRTTPDYSIRGVE